MSNEYQTYGYGVVKVNNQDATIRYGTYDVELYRPPINLQKRNKHEAVSSSIKITLG